MEVKAVVTTEEYVGGVHRSDVVQSLHDCPDKLIHGAVRRTISVSLPQLREGSESWARAGRFATYSMHRQRFLKCSSPFTTSLSRVGGC